MASARRNVFTFSRIFFGFSEIVPDVLSGHPKSSGWFRLITCTVRGEIFLLPGLFCSSQLRSNNHLTTPPDFPAIPLTFWLHKNAFILNAKGFSWPLPCWCCGYPGINNAKSRRETARQYQRGDKTFVIPCPLTANRRRPGQKSSCSFC